MLRPRFIPCLLIYQGGLVKTINFANRKYVGDPINVVRIFNEKEVDELMLLDIGATTLGGGIDFQLIEDLANQCQMPICYGGGINTVQQAERIVELGVEKVAISSAAVRNPSLVGQCVQRLGSQSVTVVIDVKRVGFFNKEYQVFTGNGSLRSSHDLCQFVKRVEDLGVGELVINSIDRDGTMDGYDFNLIDKVWEKVNVPLTILGGAGHMDHFEQALSRYGVLGVGAGSLFVFQGKYRAVLVSYLHQDEKDALIQKGLRYN